MKVLIPESWNEVTVGQYQEFAQATNDVDRVSILLDEDPEVVRKCDPQSMTKILSNLSWVKNLPEQHKYKLFIEIDNVEYRLVHNLNGFSLGEWVDMDEYQKDPDNNLHLIFSMLYRPLGEYRSEDVKPRAELFRERAMIGDLYGSLVFFSLVAAKSTPSIQRYLIRTSLLKMKRRKKKENGSQTKEPQKNGAGTTTPTV